MMLVFICRRCAAFGRDEGQYRNLEELMEHVHLIHRDILPAQG